MLNSLHLAVVIAVLLRTIIDSIVCRCLTEIPNSCWSEILISNYFKMLSLILFVCLFF